MSVAPLVFAVLAALSRLSSPLSLDIFLAPQGASATRAARPRYLSPQARRFLAPPRLSYQAGTERVQDGELAIASPRPFDGMGLLPAPDDHQGTTSYATIDASAVRRHEAWTVGELSSLHELPGGAVLGATFRVDAREQTTLGGIATVAVPLPDGAWVLPTAGVAGVGPDGPEGLFGAELRTDRRSRLGYTFGVEGSEWSEERWRALGIVGGVYRVTRAVALEERVGLGSWAGHRVGGELALRWTSAALQDIGARFDLYERVTVARGPTEPTGPEPTYANAFSCDVSMGIHRSLGAYGVALQVSEGAQEGVYQRFGAALTLHGALF